MDLLQKSNEWTRGEKARLHNIVHQVALFERLIFGPSLGDLSLLVFRRMAERMGLLAHQEEEFEREESRYHMYNSAAMVLFLVVFIAFLFCIGVIVLVLLCYIMPFCVMELPCMNSQ